MIPFFQNILLGVSLAAPVGPVSAEVIKRGLQGGFRPAFIVALGSILGDATCLVISYLGLSYVMHLEWVKTSVWAIGAAMLIYLGTQNLVQSLRYKQPMKVKVYGGTNAFFLGYILALANPISIVFWIGIFGAIIGDAADTSLSFWGLMGHTSILLGVAMWFFCLSAFLDISKRFLRNRYHNIDRIIYHFASGIAGAFLIGFGVFYLLKAVDVLT